MAATPQDPFAKQHLIAHDSAVAPLAPARVDGQDSARIAAASGLDEAEQISAFEGVAAVLDEAPPPEHPGFDPPTADAPWDASDGDRGFDDEPYTQAVSLANQPAISHWRGRSSAVAAAGGRAVDPARPAASLAIAAADLLTERALLGSCLVDHEALPLAMSEVKAEDFYDQRHVWIFTAMLTLNARHQPIESMSVLIELRVQRHEDQVGMTYLFELTEAVGATLAVEHHARRVARLSAVRRILRASQQIQSDFQVGDDPDEFIQRAQKTVTEALTDSVRTAAVGLDEIVRSVFEQILEAKKRGSELLGISTGYRDLDKLTQGMHPTNLIVLAARPAMGKTALAMNIALDVALRPRREPDSRGHTQHGVLVFSMEMGREELVQRLLSARARIELTSLRKGLITPDDEVSLRDAANDLAQARFLIDDTPGLSAHDLRARAKLAQMQGPLDLVVVDYLQLAKGTNPRQSREQEIGEISRSLKGLAKELSCTVLALAQLNRGVEQRTDKRPMMSDLRESGAIEQDADLIAFIYREIVYSKDPMHEHMAELIIAKQRAGSTGKIDLHFDGKYTRFSTMDQRINDDSMGTRRS